MRDVGLGDEEEEEEAGGEGTHTKKHLYHPTCVCKPRNLY